MKLGTVLPDGVLRLGPWEVKDHPAFLRLDGLVREAASQLVGLRQDPIAVASSPNRFDDAHTYDWRAVRCGDFISENGSYYPGVDLDRDIATASRQAKTAYAVLRALDAAGWRDLFAKAFDIRMPDQTLSIVVQNGLTWLVLSANNVTEDECDPVFAIWEDAEMSYFAEAKERFDWAIRNPVPLEFLGENDKPSWRQAMDWKD
ncbi:hypothetical protein IF803_02235 [Bradyrhizobium sp. UFLA06-06]